MRSAIAVLAALLAIGITPIASGQSSPGASASATSAPVPASDALEPDATAALARMSSYLQTLKTFSVRARTTTDQVLEDDQKVQLDAAVVMWVGRPDRLRIDLNSDRRSRQFFYDGNRVTVFARKAGYYASVPLQGTLRELADALSADYGIDLPLADLFSWSEERQRSVLTAATAFGLATIRGVACDQYVFRQDGLDWQIWIQRGPQPLPRRLVLTTTSDPARPQHAIDLEWKTRERIPESTFTFSPPSTAHPIPMRRVDGSFAPKS